MLCATYMIPHKRQGWALGDSQQRAYADSAE